MDSQFYGDHFGNIADMVQTWMSQVRMSKNNPIWELTAHFPQSRRLICQPWQKLSDESSGATVDRQCRRGLSVLQPEHYQRISDE